MSIFGNLGKITSPEDIQKELGDDADVNTYWKLCMDTLKKSILDVKQEFINTCEQNKDMYGVLEVNNEETFTKKMKEFEKHLDTCSWDSNDMYLSPTEFYTKFFSKLVNPKYLGARVGWRDLYEHLDAKQQCKIAQRLTDNPVIPWNNCYICGAEILDSHSGLPPEKQYHSSRECEHVINAFTALGYKSLIQSSNFTDNDLNNEYLMSFLKHEYANAHQCCNQIKSDDKWIARDNNTNFLIDDEALRRTLTEISRSKQVYDCNNVTLNVQQRGTYIVNNFLQPLIAIINADKKNYGAMYDIVIRINQITALQLNIADIVKSILTGQPVPKGSKTDYTMRKALTECRSTFRGTTNEGEFIDLFKKNHSLLFGQSLTEFTSRISKVININGVDNSVRLGKYIWGNHQRLYGTQNLNELGNNIRNDALLYIAEKLYSNDDGVKVDLEIVSNVIKSALISRQNIYLDFINTFFQAYGFSINGDVIQMNIQNTKAVLQESLNSMNKISGGKLIKNKKNNILMLNGGALTREQILSDNSSEDLQNIKEIIVDDAVKHGINPAEYGINIQQTRSGRLSSPKVTTSYCNLNINGTMRQIQCFNLDGLSFYVVKPNEITDPNVLNQAPYGYIANVADNMPVAPLEWEAGKGSGFYSNNESGRYFHKIGGRKKSKHSKKSSKRNRKQTRKNRSKK